MPNLVEDWDFCVGEVGPGTARVWGLYMAGSRWAFERNEIQLHQVLGVKLTDDGHARPCRCGPTGRRGRPGGISAGARNAGENAGGNGTGPAAHDTALA